MTPAPCPECGEFPGHGELLDKLAALRARVAELEAQHDNAADMFASGRRYERALAGLRAPALDGLIADLKQQLNAERARVLGLEAELDALTAVLKRARSVVDGWRFEARAIQAAGWTMDGGPEFSKGYATAQRDCAAELEAILPPKVSP